MLNNVYTEKSTGEKVRIVNEDVSFYELDNSVRIKKDVFIKKYEMSDEIDPNSFFQAPSNDPLLNLAQQIKNLDSSKVSDVGGGAQVKFIEKPVVIADSSLPPGARQNIPQMEGEIPLSPEEKKAMLNEWRNNMPGAQIDSIQNKNWDDDDDERLLNGDKPIKQQEQKKEEPKVDPIQMMFKMFKNNYDVKLDISIEEKIPNPTFIAMVQDNVEADAIEYYAKIITDKLLKDPDKIKSEIYEQLKVIVNKELGDN